LGADTEARDHQGWTALHYACRVHWPGMVAMLVRHGAAVDARTDKGETPLDIVHAERKRGYDSFVQRENEAILKAAGETCESGTSSPRRTTAAAPGESVPRDPQAVGPDLGH